MYCAMSHDAPLCILQSRHYFYFLGHFGSCTDGVGCTPLYLRRKCSAPGVSSDLLHFDTGARGHVDFKFNMTLGTSQAARAARGPTQFVESVTFPLFLGGERRSRAQLGQPRAACRAACSWLMMPARCSCCALQR